MKIELKEKPKLRINRNHPLTAQDPWEITTAAEVQNLTKTNLSNIKYFFFLLFGVTSLGFLFYVIYENKIKTVL